MSGDFERQAFMILRLTLRNFATVSVAILALFFLGGCANQYQPILESANGGTLAITSTTNLLVQTPPVIPVADARAVHTAGVGLSGALHTWQTIVDNPLSTSANILVANQAAMTALTNLENALANVDVKAKLSGKVKARMAGKPPASVTIPDVIAIIQLFQELEPGLVSFVDQIFTGSTATDAQVTTAIAALDSDNALLLAAIKQAGG